MNQISDLDKLRHIKTVEGFAKIGVFPAQNQVQKCEDYLADLEREGHFGSNSFSSAKIVILALKRNILPSQEACRDGMREIDSVLLPLRAQKREEQSMGQQSYERPRGG